MTFTPTLPHQAAGQLHDSSYTDVQALQSINKLGKTDKLTALEKVAEQFESIMIRMMMQSMRDANKVFAEGNPFNSHAGDTFQQMYDDQLSVNLNDGGGLGLAEVIVRQLAKNLPSTQSNTDAEPVASNDLTINNYPLRPGVAAPISPIKDVEPSPLTQESTLKLKDKPTAQPLSASLIKLNQFIPLGRAEQVLKTSEIQPVTRIESTNKSVNFDGSADHFVEQLYPYAKEVAEKLGVSPSVILAQAALETGWGKHVNQVGDSGSSHNLFNIKSHNWSGQVTEINTNEYIDGQKIALKDSFRAYDSVQQSFDDYYQFIIGNKRYRNALQTSNSEDYVKAIHQAGYATDPDYSEKIMAIANGESMQQAIARFNNRQG